MKWLLSVDPGVKASGCALWRGAELMRAELLATDRVLTLQQWCYEHTRDECLQAIVEKPQTYGGRAAKGDANDLIEVALVAGAVSGQMPTQFVRPSDWKGQVPKEVIQQRATLDLSPNELVRVHLPRAKSLRHNVWDAVGIGLWYLKRAKQR